MSPRDGLRVALVGLGFGAEFVPIYLDHPDVESVTYPSSKGAAITVLIRIWYTSSCAVSWKTAPLKSEYHVMVAKPTSRSHRLGGPRGGHRRLQRICHLRPHHSAPRSTFRIDRKDGTLIPLSANRPLTALNCGWRITLEEFRKHRWQPMRRCPW